MRIMVICCSVLCLAAGNAVADNVYEPHAMLYYQVSFSANGKDRKASYGLRLDQTYHSRNEVPDFRSLLSRPALAEFRLASDGTQFLNIAGTDVGRAYRVNSANGEETTAGTPEAGEPASGETSTDESGDATEEEPSALGQYLEDIPAGYLIGIGLGIVLLTGVAD